MMGKFSFFLGLQIFQNPRGIFINQSKYALESLKEYGMESSDPVDTPMVEKSKLDEDPQRKAVDPTPLTAKPTEKHLHAIKRIFKYLRGTVNRGLWQKSAAISSTEAGYIAPSGCWLAFKFLKGIRTNFSELKYDFEECYKALSEKFDWDNLEGGDYLFNCTKPFPLVMNGNRQIVPVDYFFNNDLKYLQEGISTMTYTTSTIKTRAAQYDLQGIKDMVPNIWNPVKVAYDKHARWSISHWRKQRKTFYAYARGLASSQDVYSTKRILAVTRVEEGDFPRLRINEIEDMLLLIVQNMLTNLSGDDVFDFAIALRMFIRSMVVQKRVRDLQMGVKSYQKKINITKPETTTPDIRKRDPYTLYTDPQGFIYVDNQGRNR
ncbi:putative reverse transcriptase domain-containing protein [Tanacetum coccineum]